MTTCGGIWWMKKKDPALLLAKEYRDEYRQTAASRKEQRCVDLLWKAATNPSLVHCDFVLPAADFCVSY